MAGKARRAAARAAIDFGNREWTRPDRTRILVTITHPCPAAPTL
jgi:hypothetical protein